MAKSLDKIRMAITVDPYLKQWLKVEAAKQGITMEALFALIVNEYRRGRK